MEKKIISQNLRRLRKFKKMTQAETAEKAGISRPAYRNIETGKSEPKVGTLRAIAIALNVKVLDLIAPVKTLSAVRFRAHKRMTSREQILVDVATWLDNFNGLEELLNESKPFKLQKLQKKLGSYSGQDRPEYAAREVRKILLDKGDDGSPIRNIAGLLDDGGVKVYPYSLASEGFFGLSVGAKDGGPAIVVNTWDRITVERWIFSMAHELGHLLLHLASFEVEESGTEDATQEKEANDFASHFLMPRETFNKEWKRSAGLHFYDRVLKVKRLFRVSYASVIYRAIQDLPKNKQPRVWAMFKSEHKRRSGQTLTNREEPEGLVASTEPFKLTYADSMEDRLSLLVRMGIMEGEISMGRGAEILNLNLYEMRDRTKSWVLD